MSSTNNNMDDDYYEDDDEEEEIAKRVEAEMRAVLAGLKPVHNAIPSADQLRKQRSFSPPASLARSTSPTMHEEERRRQELEASVQARAKYLFEAMKKEQEELELRRIEDEIERRVQGACSHPLSFLSTHLYNEILDPSPCPYYTMFIT